MNLHKNNDLTFGQKNDWILTTEENLYWEVLKT